MNLRPSPIRVLLVFAVAITPVFILRSEAGELDDYVAREDGALAYKLHNDTTTLGVRALTFRLTSQRWRGIEWQHWLSVIIPKQIDPHSKCVLIIDGGSSRSRAPNARSKQALLLANSAMKLRAPIALLSQVPNQPLFDNLHEDHLIAHTFKNYLDSGDADWPLLLPMTKSAVRAMDALSALAKDGKLNTAAGGEVALEKFIVTGASKRGWTTWLTGAVDDRVCAIAPMVIDVLDMPAQMERQQRTYGGFSDMIKPYTQRGIQKRMRTTEGKRLNAIVDPVSYNPRYTMPKLVLLGTNDPYWTVDSASVYFDKLPAKKSLYYLPNAGHGLGFEALATGDAFFAAQLDGKPFPELTYKRDGDKLTVSWKGSATAVELWFATSPDRDFRKQKWTAAKLEAIETTVIGGRVRTSAEVTAPLKTPADGWSAHFVRVTFPPVRKGMSGFKLATPIIALPDSFPHKLPEK